jgi:hypothetical protein
MPKARRLFPGHADMGGGSGVGDKGIAGAEGDGAGADFQPVDTADAGIKAPLQLEAEDMAPACFICFLCDGMHRGGWPGPGS